MKSSSSKQKRVVSADAITKKLQKAPQAPQAAVDYARPVQENARATLVQQLNNKLNTGGLWSETETISSDERDLLHLTLEFLGSWHRSNPPPGTTPWGEKAAKIAALAANLQRCMRHLERLSADGDRPAIELLARHTLDASYWLSGLRKTHLHFIKPVARTSVFWPVLKSRCQYFDDIGKSLNQDDAIFLRDLDVGRDHPIQGRKVNLGDELGVLIMKLLDEVQSYKAGGHLFVLPRWGAKAMQLKNLTPRTKSIAEWAGVLDLMLAEKFNSPAAMAKKFQHLVSPTKRVGEKRILGELRHLMKSRLSALAGMNCRSIESTPSSAWWAGRQRNSTTKK